MDDQEFNEWCKRLKEVNKVITDLDPAIKKAAYKTLKQYVTGKDSHSKAKECNESQDQGGDGDVGLMREEFFCKFPSKKESDNVMLVLAWLYSQYSNRQFSLGDIKKVADEGGLSLSDRLSDTLTQARYKGKSCFKKTGKKQGVYAFTAHGQRRLKDNYQVKKGRKVKPAEDS